jgi:hypothetical protein
MSPLRYENRVLGYFDILGWSDLIRKSEKTPDIIPDLEGALKSTGDIWDGRPRTPEHVVQFAQFSDHVCISTLATHDKAVAFIGISVGALVLKLLQMGYATRGALVVGPLVHAGNRIFGPALVEAHEIESKVAKYPRLVLSGRALELAAALPRNVLRKDIDGLSFLDVFAVLDSPDQVQEIRRALDDNPPTRDSLDIRAKRGWLLEYLRRRDEELRRA